MVRFFDVSFVLMMRMLNARYRGSWLGIGWSLLNPLIMTGVYTAVFGRAFSAYYGRSLIGYALAAFIGLIVMNFFVQSTQQTLTSVVGNGQLLNKISIPAMSLPIAALASNAAQLLIGLVPILVALTIWRTGSALHVLALFIPLVALILLAGGVGLFLSATYVYFRDIGYLYELIIFLIWMISPVFYPLAIVPPRIGHFLTFNPIFPLLESLRTISLTQNFPQMQVLGLGSLEAVVAAAIGYFSFRALRPGFIDLL